MPAIYPPRVLDVVMQPEDPCELRARSELGNMQGNIGRIHAARLDLIMGVDEFPREIIRVFLRRGAALDEIAALSVANDGFELR